jgi:hypothetical protein
VRNDPPDFLHETCVRNCLFTLEHAAALPRLEVESADRVEGGVRVRVANRSLLPTVHEMAQRFRVLPPDRVALEGARVVAAVRERPGSAAEVLDVRAGAALLPDGVPGESSATLVLFADGVPTRVVAESRLGGVARMDLPP